MSAQAKKVSKLSLINAASLREIDSWTAKYPPEERKSLSLIHI